MYISRTSSMMEVKFVTSLLVMCVFGVTLFSPVSGIIHHPGKIVKMLPSYADMMVHLHNKYRRMVSAADMTEMAWDANLAAIATRWAKQCRYNRANTRHTDLYGENLFLSDRRRHYRTTLTDAVGHWQDEGRKYGFSTADYMCNQTCQYAQMMWARSNRVGCAMSNCMINVNSYGKLKQSTFVTCFYSPRGNIPGERVYTPGRECSLCPRATCYRGLCRYGSRVQEDKPYRAPKTTTIRNRYNVDRVFYQPGQRVYRTGYGEFKNKEGVVRYTGDVYQYVDSQHHMCTCVSMGNDRYKALTGNETVIYGGNPHGTLSSEEKMTLEAVHNSIRRGEGISEIVWSTDLEKWAVYVIRCDIQYPGPRSCYTNFGKGNVYESLSKVVYDWHDEGAIMAERRPGCRTPYDRKQCNRNTNILERRILNLGCAAIQCERKRQLTCIYQ